MLVGVSGTFQSGKHEVLNFLELHGFKLLDNSLPATELVQYATKHWLEDHALLIENDQLLQEALTRPFFLHIAVDAPLQIRFSRQSERSLEDFVAVSDLQNFSFARKAAESAHIKLVNNFPDTKQLYIALSKLDIRNPTRVRPSWDAYFMRLAELAALRSNCMKRRVGCVIVRNHRVVATGYNGTARGMRNCNEGGCARCNAANGRGSDLNTCLCLHAEENALLEAGIERLGGVATVYCNTCPCLTCSIKIVQAGVKEVVYSRSYFMDTESASIFAEAGIQLRQYTPPKEFVA